MSELPTTLKEAKAKGVPRYFTGKPCKHGHISERATASGNCIECYTTTHLALRRNYMASKENRENSIRNARILNDVMRSRATNAYVRWCIEDLKLIISKDKKGNYIISSSEAATLLRRSCRAVSKARERYGHLVF